MSEQLGTDCYNTAFYEDQSPGAYASGLTALSVLFAELCMPSRVIDVGGGVGAWARAALELGAAEAWVLDGSYVDPDLLEIPHSHFIAHDLEHPLPSLGSFDLCICLEVAEHLTPERGPALIAELCALSDTVLFGAAIPGQGGTHHINERWQTYWVEQFATQGFAPWYATRGLLWDLDIEWWYAQNSMVFVRGAAPMQAELRQPLDQVHPRLWSARESLRRESASASAPGKAHSRKIWAVARDSALLQKIYRSAPEPLRRAAWQTIGRQSSD